MSGHPSFLELDRAALGRGGAGTAAHLEGCSRCQAHLSTLERPVPFPAWARELPPAAGVPWWRSLRVMLGALAGAAAALLFAVLPTRPSYVGAKGGPTVGVYVKRGAAISIWNGADKLQAGDSLQLKVAPHGFPRVTVAGRDRGALVRLYDGVVDPDVEALLPLSFALDAEPGAEVLLIVFSRAELPDAALPGLLARPRREGAVWATRLSIEKEADR